MFIESNGNLKITYLDLDYNIRNLKSIRYYLYSFTIL